MAKRKRKPPKKRIPKRYEQEDTGFNLTPLTASEVMGDIEAEFDWLEMARRRMEELGNPENRNVTHDVPGDPIDWTEVMKHGLRGGDPARTYGIGAAMPYFDTGRDVEGVYGHIRGMNHEGRPEGIRPGPSPIALNTQTLQGRNIPRPDVNTHRSQRNRQADFNEWDKVPMIDTLMHELGHRSVDYGYPQGPGGAKSSFVDEGKYDSPEHQMIRAATKRRGYHTPDARKEAQDYANYIGKGYGDWDSKTQKFTKSKESTSTVAKQQLRAMRRHADKMQELRKEQEKLQLRREYLRRKKEVLKGFYDQDEYNK
tara:strand:- start:37 stop:972 length:936 start_codon:yes stop_codon:yes gene_type:complete